MQVTFDPELEQALVRAAPSLRGASRAAQIRELALRGAEALDGFDSDAYSAAVEQLLREDMPGLAEVVAQRHAGA